MFGVKKRLTIAIVSAILLLTAAVGTTYAVLTSLAGPVENTFTIGKVEITLTETTGADYSLIPGKVIEKDPTVTVLQGSEDCWLYVSVMETAHFRDYLSYEMAEGWYPLVGHAGVYYRHVTGANGDTAISILKDNCVKVSDSLTEEIMSGIRIAPSLTFSAYAIQHHGVETATDGWTYFREEVSG